MTRPNSVEIGGRDSRTTSSMACRNDEPARSALAIRVIVSGSCLLKALRRPLLRRFEPEAREQEADEGADEQDERVAERREERRSSRNMTTGTPTIAADPDEEELGRLELEVGARELAREVGAEVALLDDLVEVGQRLRSGRSGR